MAKKSKPRVSGAGHRRKKNLKAILVPLEQEEHALLNHAAGTILGRRRSVCQFVREAAVAAARVRLAEWEQERISGKSSES